MNKVFRFAVITVVTLVILLAAGLVTFFAMFPPEKIKDLAVSQLEPVLGRKIKVERAKISIYPVLGITLSGFEVSNTSREGFLVNDPFVKLDNFVVQISVMSMFKGYPEVSAVILQKPRILVEVDTSGAFNFDDMAILAKKDNSQEKKSSEGPLALPVPVTMKKFLIEGGEIVYLDHKEKREVKIGELNHEVRISVDKELRNVLTTGSLVLNNISLKTKEISKPLSNLSFTLTHDVKADLVSGKVDVNSLRLSLQKIYLNMAGTVTGLNEGIPVLDLAVNSDPIDLKDLLAEVPVELAPEVAKLTGSGTAELAVNVRGSFEENKPLPVKGSLVFKNGMVKYAALPKSVNSINAQIDFSDNTLDVKRLSLLLGENPVNVKASVVNFKKPLVDATVDASINLTDAKDFAQLPPGMAVSGMLKANVRAKGEADPTDPAKLDVNGKIDLQNVNAMVPPLSKPAMVNGVVNLTSKSITNDLSVKMGQSSMSISAVVSNFLSLVLKDEKNVAVRPNLDFKVNSPLLNVDEFMPPSEKKPEQSGKTEKSGPMIAPLPGVDVNGVVSAQKIIYQKMEMNNFSTKVSVKNDVADVNVSSGLAGGTIQNVLKADLRNISNVSFSNKLNVANVEVNNLMVVAGDFIKPTTALNRELRNLPQSLFGKVNVSGELAGSGGTPEAITQSITGNLGLKVGEGRIANTLLLKRMSGAIDKFTKVDDIHFRNLSADVRFADGKAIFEDLKINSDLAGDWMGKGTVSFGTDLDMAISNRLPKSVSGNLLSLQSSGKNMLKGLLSGTQLEGAAGLVDGVGVPSDKEGRVTLKLALKGTLADPKVMFSGFGEGDGTQTGPKTPGVQQQAVQKLQQAVDQRKEELEKKMAEERARAEEELRKKAEEQRAALEAQKKAQEENLRKEAEQLKKEGEQLKNKATQKLKKMF